MEKDRPLTPKQMAFAGFVAKGLTYSESYRKAYGAENYSKPALAVEASRMMKDERVQRAVEELKADNKETKKAHKKLTGKWILERLADEAMDESNPPSTRVRALELLGKSEGIFEESTRLTVEHRKPEDVERELRQRLEEMFGAQH
jgi:hypothetical protein